MPINALSSEIISLAGPADSGLYAAVVGDAISLASMLAFQLATVTVLSRRPAGSAAVVAANAFTADVPGEYDVALTNGGMTRTVRVIAFPPAALGQRAGIAPTPVTTRATLQVLVTDSRCTLANVTIALENGTPSNGGLNPLLYGLSLNTPINLAVG